MEMDSSAQIQELQILEQNLQSLLMQKQTFQIEVNELDNALNELAKADDEVYRVLSGVMLKANKTDLIKELEEKKKVASLRVATLEKQEALFIKKNEELRSELARSVGNKKA